ncbi:hypothetical protein CN514_00335 [Bacillus sp. AFS001701]|nr:hypothetical protein CN514_00335 [Bacillus sp. AFS001701]
MSVSDCEYCDKKKTFGLSCHWGHRGIHTGKGVSTKLFQSLEEWAAKHGILRLGLTVVKKMKQE